MDSKISSSSGFFISIGNKASNVFSFFSFILWCMFYSWIITLQDFYYCFHCIFRFLPFNIRFNTKANASTSKGPCPDIREVCLEMPVITREDIETVMENLGLFCDVNEHSPHKESVQGSVEIISVFDEDEPSLDEVRVTFGLFDRNGDGFIDSEELKKVMKSIGLTGFSKQECQRMIMAFDENGDGKIDFDEFVKLMEECSF